MSAYEDAYEAALKGFDPDWGLEPENTAEAIDAFLAALPPSIVVDGKVVGAADVAAVLNVEWEAFLAAAREVAE